MVITETKKDIFGGITTIISGANKSFSINGKYAVTTAKEGLFKGLSTIISESSHMSNGAYSSIAKVIYSDNLTKNERHDLHNVIVLTLDSQINSGVDVLVVLEVIMEKYFEKGLVKQVLVS
jgi:hypothetical protein